MVRQLAGRHAAVQALYIVALSTRLTTEQNDDRSNVCYVTVPLFAGSVMNDKRDCHNFFASDSDFSDVLVKAFDRY